MHRISDTHWGEMLAGYGEKRWSGTLSVVAEDRKYSLMFDRGLVIDASSPLATDAVVRIALIAQLITSTKVSEIVRRQAAAPGRSELETIVELGKLSNEQAMQLRRRVVARRAARTFSLERGDIVAEESAAVPVFSEVEVGEVIYQGARENLPAQRLMEEVERRGGWFRLKPSAIDELPRFNFGDDARPILELLRDGAPLTALETCRPGIDRRLVWSVLYALAACGACELGEADLVAPLPRKRVLETEGGELAPVARGPRTPVQVVDLIGTTIGGRYVIEQKLGIGSTGVVYRAHHTKLTRLFALKILHRGLLTDDNAVRRFEREAQLAGALSHPNVVSVVDVGTADGVPYLAMEHAEGVSLASLIAAGPMRPARVIDLLRQLCFGLTHAHERDIIHRDLKPENVIVETADDVETPRIADFALAVLRETGEQERLTAAGVVLGTPAYMAPEHASGGALDHRADLYALGVIAYQMMTGVLPFTGSNVEIAMASFKDPPPAMSTRVPGLVVDPLLEALTRALLEKKPDARPRDANEVRKLLDLIEHDRDAATVRLGVVTPPPAPEPASKHPATIAMWKLSRDPAPPPPPAPVEPPPPAAPMIVPAPVVQRARARYDGSGTVSSVLRTEAMAPIQRRPTWPIIAIVAALVLVVILVLAFAT